MTTGICRRIQSHVVGAVDESACASVTLDNLRRSAHCSLMSGPIEWRTLNYWESFFFFFFQDMFTQSAPIYLHVSTPAAHCFWKVQFIIWLEAIFIYLFSDFMPLKIPPPKSMSHVILQVTSQFRQFIHFTLVWPSYYYFLKWTVVHYLACLPVYLLRFAPQVSSDTAGIGSKPHKQNLENSIFFQGV